MTPSDTAAGQHTAEMPPHTPPALLARRIRVEALSTGPAKVGACPVDEATAADWKNLIDYVTEIGAQHSVCVRSIPLPGNGVTLDHDEILVCLRARSIHLQAEDLTEVSVHALLKVGHVFELSSPALPFRVVAVLADEEWIDG